MKQHVKKSGGCLLVSLFFTIGGLFLVNDVQAQQHAFTQVVSPQQNWISSGAAQSKVAAEIDALTVKYQQMKQAGAEPTLLQKLKAEMHVYMRIDQALKNGMSTGEAFDHAWNSYGFGPGSAYNGPFSAAEVLALEAKIKGKLAD